MIVVQELAGFWSSGTSWPWRWRAATKLTWHFSGDCHRGRRTLYDALALILGEGAQECPGRLA
jgi:hypothetical protein